MKNLPGTRPIREWNRRRRARRRLKRDLARGMSGPLPAGGAAMPASAPPVDLSPAMMAQAQAALPLLLDVVGCKGPGGRSVIIVEGLAAPDMSGIWVYLLGRAGLATVRPEAGGEAAPVSIALATTYLRTLPSAQQGGLVFADQAENLEAEAVSSFLAQARQTLMSGGLLILAGISENSGSAVMAQAENLLSQMAVHGFQQGGLLWQQDFPGYYLLFARCP
ncbi:hypothetical protein ACT6QH_01320 [Xanthobacter sp. TB0139]|uniref:hypothetical protein n=1 Tax=Xanthobacter sp. TB0139 TaxID=3459178 RepID=UPI004039549E